jgi:hypothetical protein
MLQATDEGYKGDAYPEIRMLCTTDFMISRFATDNIGFTRK